jgi:uracil-DNA glycosylase
MASAFALHCLKWKDGCGSFECSKAHRKVFARGSLPCDIALVGEAPGESEDTIGRPFCGPAGRVLDTIIKHSAGRMSKCKECQGAGVFTLLRQGDPGPKCPRGHNPPTGVPVRVGYMNLVMCIPRDEDGNKALNPSHEQITLCQPRLEELLTIASPRLVVALGKKANEWLEPGMKDNVRLPKSVKYLRMVHPAAIVRAPEASQGLSIQTAIIDLRNAVEDI